jgi:glutamate-1-semialdehyde 2,1-aminomutase
MRQFTESERLLERAQRVIPLGSQTFSKSRTQYPVGASPLFLERGHGARVWDVDGNEYIDFVNSLLSVTLGYGDKDVDEAVQRQLQDGVILSLPHRLETEVAELICEMVPCAEMVRFGKNGSDATAGAVRVARAFTGADRIAVCGYHGWQDWYIGTTARNRGVPDATRELTRSFAYNDLASLEALLTEHPGGYAAVVMEASNVVAPEPDFLQGVQRLTRAHGALFVLDETITGFRFALGGAQELYGVTPDLACFGKGLANGYPISAVAGRREVMMLMEEIFFSFTFGGELLSLAAAKATLTKLRAEPVLETLARRGRSIIDGTEEILRRHDLGHIFETAGHPSWSFLLIKDVEGATVFDIKTLLMQELHQAGFLSLGSHNISYSHSEADAAALVNAYAAILPMVGEAVAAGNLKKRLRCEPLVPLFRIR